MSISEPGPLPPDISPNDRLFAALSYLFTPLVPIIVFLLEETKARPYARYHAIQALGLAVAAFVFEIVASIVYFILGIITLGILFLCLWVLFFLPLVPMVYYAYLATKNTYFDIPWLTNFMIAQGWLSKP